MFSLRAFLVLVIAGAGFTCVLPLIPREPWPGHDKEHEEGGLFVRALNEQFRAGFEWNIRAKGDLHIMSWGIASERKQNEIRDWAVAEKARRGLTAKVQMEFYEKTDEPRPQQLYRTIEF